MPPADTDPAARLIPTDSPPDGTFAVLFQGLLASSLDATGPVVHRRLVIPLRNTEGAIIGGLWACTLLTWLNIEMLFVPEPLRRRGTGTALMLAAEHEARARGCHHALVDTFNPQAARFYERLGFIRFGELDDFPPGHRRIYYRKCLGPVAGGHARPSRSSDRGNRLDRPKVTTWSVKAALRENVDYTFEE